MSRVLITIIGFGLPALVVGQTPPPADLVERMDKAPIEYVLGAFVRCNQTVSVQVGLNDIMSTNGESLKEAMERNDTLEAVIRELYPVARGETSAARFFVDEMTQCIVAVMGPPEDVIVVENPDETVDLP